MRNYWRIHRGNAYKEAILIIQDAPLKEAISETGKMWSRWFSSMSSINGEWLKGNYLLQSTSTEKVSAKVSKTPYLALIEFEYSATQLPLDLIVPFSVEDTILHCFDSDLSPMKGVRVQGNKILLRETPNGTAKVLGSMIISGGF